MTSQQGDLPIFRFFSLRSLAACARPEAELVWLLDIVPVGVAFDLGAAWGCRRVILLQQPRTGSALRPLS
jgi:hypothetical protein